MQRGEPLKSGGCGHRRYTLGQAEDRQAKIARLSLPGAGPVRVVPCRHQADGEGWFHLAEEDDRPPGEFTPRIKSLARTRAGWGDPDDAVCEGCGRPLGPDGGEFQHRDARGAGGSRDPVINGLANALLLCPLREADSCHGLAEARLAWVHDLGFWLMPGEDPRTAPVRLYGRAGGTRLVWLSETAPAYLDRPPVLSEAA